jgi:hypothetical protein
MKIDFYELLEAIRQRPVMYIETPSITCLRAFLDGYFFTISRNKIQDFRAFHNWVAMRLGYFESTSGWANMLRESENGDEKKAFDKFFIFLDEFKKRKARVIYEAKISSRKTKATSAQIVRYTKNKGCFIRWIGRNNKIYKDEFYCYDLKTAFFFSEHFGIKLKKSDWKKVINR